MSGGPERFGGGRLETGWHAETPPGDNVVHRFVLGYAEWLEEMARRAGHPVLRTDDMVAIDSRSPSLLLNHVILRRPFAGGTDPLVDALRGFFRGAGGAFAVFSPWPLPPTPALAVGGYPPLMLRPPGGALPPAPDELVLVEVRDVDQLREYERVFVDGFPLGDLQPYRPGAAFHESILDVPGWRMWIGVVDGRAVTAASSCVSHGLVHVEWVATLPDGRGKGYGAAVTAKATSADVALPAVLIASDMGRPVYERMGYLPLFRFTLAVGQR